MKGTKTLVLASMALAANAAWSADTPPQGFQVKASVQLHGEKRLWDDGAQDLLDKYYIRANFGGKYTAEDVTGEFNIRGFGPTFGNLVLADKTKDKDSVITTKAVDNFVLEKAIVDLKPMKDLSIRIGRWASDYSIVGLFGNYIDNNVDPTKLFLSRVYYHDAVEFTYKSGPVSSAVLVGGSDKLMNTGYVRVVETVKVPQIKLVVDAGWRGNVLDSLGYSDSKNKLYNRFFVRLQDTIMPGLIPYAEVAMIDVVTKGVLVEKQQGVANVGVQIPMAMLGLKNSQVNIESQFEKDRKVADINDGNALKDRPFDWNIALVQKFGKRTKLQLFAFSDPTAASAASVQIGSRLTIAVD